MLAQNEASVAFFGDLKALPTRPSQACEHPSADGYDGLRMLLMRHLFALEGPEVLDVMLEVCVCVCARARVCVTVDLFVLEVLEAMVCV